MNFFPINLDNSGTYGILVKNKKSAYNTIDNLNLGKEGGGEFKEP